ncbi:MAG: pyridoxamine 5'-phosphate oxidase family protein [Eubacterium sp.]|nr:pyridoxamine 5'-phosphate oxidase family protein [Eubacterium sp.]
MTKEEMIDFMNANPVMHLATMDGDCPRVRAMLLFKADEKGIVFHTANTKDVYKQMMDNSNVEICFNSPEMQLRVSGVVSRDDDPELREEIFNHPTRKFLQAWKDNGIDNLMTVFRVTKCAGVTWTMQTNFEPKEPVVITD